MRSAALPISDLWRGSLQTTQRRMVRDGEPSEDNTRRLLAEDLLSQPLHQVLFPRHPIEDAVVWRRAAMTAAHPAYQSALGELNVDAPNLDLLWALVLPLVNYLMVWHEACGRPPMIGVVGGPGVGKTTLAYGLAACLNALNPTMPGALVLSLEDFYLDPKERERHGLRWRAMPGSHDICRLQRVIEAIHERRRGFAVPRYDMARDRKLADEFVLDVGFCVVEGWLVGYNDSGYDVLDDKIDFLVSLEADELCLREWRFEREARIVAASGGKAGYSIERLTDFWDQVLGPGIKRLVPLCVNRASVRVFLDGSRRVTRALGCDRLVQIPP